MTSLLRTPMLATLLGAAAVVSCVSEQTVTQLPRQEPPPRRRQPSPPSRVQRTPAPTITAQRPQSHATWFPVGRRLSRRWTTIVLHHSATPRGSARLFDREHRDKGWDELGYHFVIGNGVGSGDGQIEVGPRWNKQKHGAHCKTPSNYYNEHGIGICLVGDFTTHRPSARQLASLNRLVRFLCDRCSIAPARVTTHGAVTRKTACPGRHFPISALRRALADKGPADVVTASTAFTAPPRRATTGLWASPGGIGSQVGADNRSGRLSR